MWNPEPYFESLYTNNQPKLTFNATTDGEWQDWRDRLKGAVFQVLGELPDRSQSLAPRVIEEVDFPEYTRQKVEYTIAEKLIVPAYVLIPRNRNSQLPAVVACHGHGFGCKDIVGLNPDGTENKDNPGYQKWFAVELVKRGFVVIAPELIGFGEVRLPADQNDPNPEKHSCVRLSTRLLLYGQTMAGLRTYQIMRTIDYLSARSEVDSLRIGCMGISGGGTVCTLAAALDDRIKAAVISGYISTYKDSIMAMDHCIDNFVPGILKYGEMADIAGLIAPRPLLLESASDDHIFPIAAAKHAFQRLQSIYSVAGAPGNVDQDAFAGTHEISGAKAYDWLQTVM